MLSALIILKEIRLPSAVEFRSSRMKLLHGNAVKAHMCLAYQFITVIMESSQGKEWNLAFLIALGNRQCCRRVLSCVLYSVELLLS